jgi:UDP-N-acetylglucosamine--N-acetylmuramyl-(pentapeptide) pyrophosphoryl-undecaprenol N-acetylglucosamine transferase
MRGPVVRPVVIAAGGTGGHLFPAEALGAELVARGHRVVLMTDARTGARPGAFFGEREMHVLRGAGIAGRGALRGAAAVAGLALGVAQARALLARLDPLAIVGFGGYPSIPPVLGSRFLRHRPAVLLHEQNAVLGRTNRRFARYATHLALSFPATRGVPEGIARTVTGNPVRPQIKALSGQGYTGSQNHIRLLVLGGSLGARVFSDVIPAALAMLPETLRTRLVVTQQCRGEDLERVRHSYAQSRIPAVLESFFPDVAELLAKAHLVVSRAGASSVAELAVAGRPAILVPLPGAIDDHQAANAEGLQQQGGAIMLRQDVATPASLASTIETLLAEPNTLVQMAGQAATLGRPDAAVALADLTEQHIREAAAEEHS